MEWAKQVTIMSRDTGSCGRVTSHAYERQIICSFTLPVDSEIVFIFERDAFFLGSLAVPLLQQTRGRRLAPRERMRGIT